MRPLPVLKEMNVDIIQLAKFAQSLNFLSSEIFESNKEAGWWTDIKTGEDITATRNRGELMMLIVSEVAEAMEGHRKDLMDDKLPHRKMVEVEMADALIRIFDFCGALDLDVGGALIEKWAYNKSREDHKIANRLADGGKKY